MFEELKIELVPPRPRSLSEQAKDVGKFFSKSNHHIKPVNYSFSITAAICFDRVVGFQVIEGGTDTIVFENFLYHLLSKL